VVWVTKYRYPILGGDVGERCRELLREISRSHEMTIYAGAINRDHVHMLIGIPPQLSVSRAVQFLKGKSSHKLLSEFASLRRRYWGQHLWGRGYWVASSGNVTDEVWKRAISRTSSHPHRTMTLRCCSRPTSTRWLQTSNHEATGFSRWSIHLLKFDFSDFEKMADKLDVAAKQLPFAISRA
jgi:putative transposase